MYFYLFRLMTVIGNIFNQAIMLFIYKIHFSLCQILYTGSSFGILMPPELNSVASSFCPVCLSVTLWPKKLTLAITSQP